MQWISVTLASGRASLVDLAKVLYVTEMDDGCRLHFYHNSVDLNGKRIPVRLNIKEPVELVARAVKRRTFF